MTVGGYYEFEVTLADIKPRIWRRFILSSNATFADLHDAIQDAMGWKNAHLWVFQEPGRDGKTIAGIPDEEDEDDQTPDALKVPLADLFDGADRKKRCQYLCYAYTRIQSVRREVPGEPNPAADFSLLSHDNEKNLLRELYDFNRALRAAAEQMRPNLAANALFQIAKEFSRTYRTCSVKYAETPALAEARLALFPATGRALGKGLALLGIEPPERM